jgi:glycosyltransferase involved in cell wall biosynthesis
VKRSGLMAVPAAADLDATGNVAESLACAERPLRIAMIGCRGVPATFGGVERHVEEIGSRLAARGHDVTVFCRTNYSETAVDAHRGMRLVHVPSIDSKHLDAIVHSGRSTLRALREDFDVVHYHAVGPGLAAPLVRLRRRPAVVQTVHGLDGMRAKWGLAARTVLGVATSMSARVPDATVVVSRALADHYLQRYGRDAVYIPNGVDRKRLSAPTSVLERLGVQPGRFFLSVGRLVPEKAARQLIEAFRQVDSDMRLVVAGGSSFTDEYVSEVQRAAAGDPRVVLPGYVYGDDLVTLYQSCAAFVIPSLLEGLPLTLLEAIAAQAPIVASDIPPHQEVLGRVSSPGVRLFSSGNWGQLTEALRDVAEQSANLAATRTAVSLLSARVLNTYSWDSAVEQLEQTYRYVSDQRVYASRSDRRPPPPPVAAVVPPDLAVEPSAPEEDRVIDLRDPYNALAA